MKSNLNVLNSSLTAKMSKAKHQYGLRLRQLKGERIFKTDWMELSDSDSEGNMADEEVPHGSQNGSAADGRKNRRKVVFTKDKDGFIHPMPVEKRDIRTFMVRELAQAGMEKDAKFVKGTEDDDEGKSTSTSVETDSVQREGSKSGLRFGSILRNLARGRKDGKDRRLLTKPSPLALSLHTIRLAGNRLRELPDSFSHFRFLQHLNIEQNPISSPPAELSVHGPKVMRCYFLLRSLRMRQIKEQLKKHNIEYVESNLTPEAQDVLSQKSQGRLSEKDLKEFDSKRSMPLSTAKFIAIRRRQDES